MGDFFGFHDSSKDEDANRAAFIRSSQNTQALKYATQVFLLATAVTTFAVTVKRLLKD
jgi:uncharacterized membrane protein YhaH (DUF805 family)